MVKLYSIELKEVGRNNASYKIEWSAISFTIALNKAFEEVCKHLMSSEVELHLIDNKKNLYEVLVGGWRKVGEVTIKEIKEVKNGEAEF